MRGIKKTRLVFGGSGGAMALAAALRDYENSVVIERLRGVDEHSNNQSLVWWFISANPSVTWEVVQALRKKPWSFSALSRNPNIRWRHVLAEPKQSWCAAAFYDDPAFCEDAGVEVGVAALEGEWKPFASMEMYRRSPHYRWTILTVLRPRLLRSDRDMVEALLQNPAVVTEEALEALPGFAWEDFAGALAENPAMDAELLSKLFLRRPEVSFFWNWGRYSCNPALSWRTGSAYPDKAWDGYYLSLNPRVTNWARFQARPEGPVPGIAWNWRGLSRNPAVATWARVCEHPTLPWDWEGLCGNRAVAQWDTCVKNGVEIRLNHRIVPSNWRPWAVTHVWMSIDICTPTERETFVCRWRAARRIQRVWRAVIANPAYRVCQRRLMLEWSELSGA